MFASPRFMAAAALAAAGIGSASAAETYISATVAGVVAPGVYGRIDIGNMPPPPVLYAQPVVIARPVVPLAPLYLYVPPGHAKNWGKHCAKYNACAHPVYFVNVDSRGKFVQKDRGPRGGQHYDRDGGRHGHDGNWDHDGHGKGHGKGKGKKHDD